jgi:guanylate kinase
MVSPQQGLLFILSAPSGAGKSTLGGLLRTRIPDLAYSVSYTTRAPRRGEVDGQDYHFINRTEFEMAIAGKAWAEWARVHDNYYGTRAEDLQRLLDQGRDILLDIDVQGARQLVERFPMAVTIFIMPPSLEVLEERLRQRGTDEKAVIAKRLNNARQEMAQRNDYRHVIVNDDLETAANALVRVIETYRSTENHRL